MLPLNGRSNFKSLFSGFFRRTSIDDNTDTSDTNEHFLTHEEAAQLLQPFMSNKDAFAWLEVDRNVDPSLPFVLIDNDVYYRHEEVKAFIRRLSKGTANKSDENSQAKIFLDRRCDKERRDLEFYFANSERRILIDRRSGFDRREDDDRRKIKDDFGYGRSGDRRNIKLKDI